MSVMLRLGIVALTLATAYIHFTLGSAMFLANALGFVVLAGAMAAPVAIAERHRWLIRAALAAFTVATIVGWLVFGARFWLAYVDKAIEIALIALLLVEMFRYDGGPANVLQRLVDRGMELVRIPFAKRGQA